MIETIHVEIDLRILQNDGICLLVGDDAADLQIWSFARRLRFRVISASDFVKGVLDGHKAGSAVRAPQLHCLRRVIGACRYQCRTDGSSHMPLLVESDAYY